MEFIFASSYSFLFFFFLYSSQIISLFASVVENELGRKGNLFFHILYLSKFDTTLGPGGGSEDEKHSEVVCGANRDE
jgi:hypothetical protein